MTKLDMFEILKELDLIDQIRFIIMYRRLKHIDIVRGTSLSPSHLANALARARTLNLDQFNELCEKLDLKMVVFSKADKAEAESEDELHAKFGDS